MLVQLGMILSGGQHGIDFVWFLFVYNILAFVVFIAALLLPTWKRLSNFVAGFCIFVETGKPRNQQLEVIDDNSSEEELASIVNAY